MTQTNKPNQKAEQAQREAEQVATEAKAKAADLKDATVEGGQQVAETAKLEAAQVAGEARDQVRTLIDSTVGEFRTRANDGQNAIATTVRGLSDELGQLGQGKPASGPVAEFVSDIASRGDNLAQWLEQSSPDDVLLEVRRFAARKPGTFLAIAAGAGLLAGRLARGTRDLASDAELDTNPYQRRAQFGESRFRSEGYQVSERSYTEPQYTQPQYTEPQYTERRYAQDQPNVEYGYAHVERPLDREAGHLQDQPYGNGTLPGQDRPGTTR